MSFAEVAPKATRTPMLNGSESTSNTALEATRRFEGDANGIIFMPKETNRTLSNSISNAIFSIALAVSVCNTLI